MVFNRALIRAAVLTMILGGGVESARAQTNLAAKVKYAPSVNGRIEGSVWQFQGEGLNFNSGAVITGGLLVPGTPGLNINGSPTFGGTITNTGSASPSGYWITLNSGSTLGNLVVRTTPGTLTSVSTPPSSSGTRSVYINSSSDSAGDFSTLKNLGLNGGGVFYVPPGTYDTFTANSGTGFRLGVTNGTTAVVYSFQSLNLNGSADIQVVGPVEIRVKNGFSANGAMGTSAHPEWLIIKISNGGFNFNSAYTMYGHVIAPSGTVTINSGCTIAGTVEADRLTVNSNGKLQWATMTGTGNQAPTANALSVTTNEDTATSITLTGSDPESNALTYTVVSGPSHGTLSGTAPNLTYTPATNYFGSDSFTFKVNDGTVDSGTATVSITVTSVNDAPVLAVVANHTVTEGTALSITNSVTDVDSTVFSYSLSGAPTGMVVDANGVITWTPTEAQGPSTNAVSVTVTDNGTPALSSTRSFTVTVLETNSAPVLAAIANQTVYVGQLLTVTNSAADSDLPANVLAYSLGTNAPPGMAINATNGTVTWTAGAGYANTTNTVSVTVTDDGVPSLSDTKIFTVTVLATNNAPVLASISNQVVVEEQLLTLTVAANDADGDALIYSLGLGTATGISINATNGVITWMPTEAQGPSTNLVTVIVTDNGVPSLSDTNSFLITVLETNTAPVVAAMTNRTMFEGELLSVQTVATDSDIPANTLTYSLLFTNVSPGLSINATNGLITWVPGEAIGPGVRTVWVVVTDNGMPAKVGTNAFYVFVQETNAAPVFAAIGTQTVVEAQLLTVAATATDSDIPANTLTYSLTTNAPSGMTINANTGVISWTPTEAQGPSTNLVTVMVVDNGTPALSATTTFSVIVQEENTAPVITVATNQVVIEGMLLVLTNSATDADVPANGLTFSLGSNAPAGMVINPSNGVVTWAPTSTQAPSTNLISVIVTDDGVPPMSDSGTFLVTVLATNHAPVFGAMTNSVVYEFQWVQNVAVATDVDGDSLTFSLGTNAPTWMSINATNGFITMLPGELDGGTTNVVTVIVTDNGSPNLSAAMNFLVTVLESNMHPVLTVTDHVVTEGQTLVVTNNVVTDSDVPVNNFTFTLADAPAGMSINPTTGVITWTPTEAQGPSTNNVLVTVTDDGVPAFSDTKATQIIVLEANTAPMLAAITNQVLVEMQFLLITNVVATDVDMPTNKLSFTLGAGSPSWLQIHGTNGMIFGTPGESEGPGTNIVTVIVTDDGVPSLSATQTFTVVVLELNERPVFGFIQDQTIYEGQLLMVTNTATDVDLPAQVLTYTLGTNSPPGMVMNPTNAVITWTPGEEYGGTVMMRVQYFVTDNGNPPETAEGGFWLNILEANEAPVLAPIADRTVIEGFTLTITNSASDSDLPANALVYSLGTNAPAGMSINATNGIITWTPTEVQGPGTNLVSVIVTDDGVPSLSATQSFTVVVLETNSAPVMVAPVNQTINEGTLWTFTNLVTDADVPMNGFTFTLGTNAPAGMVINATSGVISWTPSESQGGTTNLVQVMVVDDGVPALGTNVFFTVTVLEMNTAPVLAVITNRTVLEGQTLNVAVTATDADVPTNSLSYDFVGMVPSGMVIHPVTGAITWIPTEEQGPSTNSITVRVTDNGVPALSHTRTFTVTVQEVNSAPVLVDVPNQTIYEGQLLSITNVASDADIPANTLTFSLGTNTPAGMTINATNGVVTWTPSEAQGPSTNLIRVIVADNGTPIRRDTNTFIVTVLETNAVPVLALIANQTVAEGQLLTVNASATDADLPANALLFSLGAGAPSGVAIDANSGVITWTPTEAQGPSTNVLSVIVTDNGTPSLSATQSFTVVVLEVNSAPVLAMPIEQTIFEGHLLSVTNSATDADMPVNTLVYSLGSGVPAGVSIDANTGLITWTPSELQGPSTNVIEVVVTDDGVPPLSNSVFLTVTVLETNSAPMLAAITNHTVIEGQLLSVTNVATDGDFPVNVLTFSLGMNAPAGMNINATNGIISWVPTLTQGPSTNVVNVVVADDGTPSMSATQTFTVFVLNSNVKPVAMPQTLTLLEDGSVTFTLLATDEDNDPLTLNITEGPYFGTLQNNVTNYVFTPVTNFSGQTHFVFRAFDGQDESEPATVTINVTPVNDVPMTFSRTNLVMEGQSVHVGLLAYDVDGDAVSLIMVNPPFLGTLSGANTNLTYTANTNTFGWDRFEYQISDGVSTSAVTSVMFYVTPFARGKTWTSSADFSSGTLTNLSQTVAGELKPVVDETSFNYVWVPLSKDTVVRVDAETGRVLGEYRTAPTSVARVSPSRTWVDRQGNLWVANQEDNSVAMIATPESGRWVDRNNNGVLDTSLGSGDVRAWTGTTVNGALDELIVFYVKVNGRTIRHLSMNPDGNIWAGGNSLNVFDLINAQTGQIIRTETSIGRGGYGGFTDKNGILYSAGRFLRWDTSLPITSVNPAQWNIQPDGSWNVAQDPDGNIWVTYEPSSYVRKFSPSGEEIGSYYHGGGWGQGMAIDPVSGDVWVAHSHCGNTVGHLKKDGRLVGTVEVANHGPTAVAFDRKGRLWVSSSTGVLQRINPMGGPLGADGETPVGELELTTTYLGSSTWAYSHFSGGSQTMSTQRGSWTAVFDSALTNAAWGPVTWNGLIYNDGKIVVRVASSHNGVSYGAAEPVEFEGAAPTVRSRYLKVEAEFIPASSGEGPVLYDLTVGTAGYVYTPAVQAWAASAGADIHALWPDPVLMKGAIGRSPHTNAINPSVSWSVISGPGTVTFDNLNVIQPKTTFSTNGVYVLRLTADNFGDVQTDDVTVTLTPYNRSPWVDAGENRFLRSTNDVLQLTGQVRDDGLPLTTPLRVWWRQAFGPGTTLFADVSNAVTQATFTTNGIYILELVADDGEYQQKRKIEVRVGTLCTIEEPDGIAAWWQGNGDGADHINGNQLVLPTINFFDQGRVGAAFKFDGTVAHTRAVNSPSLDVGKADGFTVEFWAKSDDLRRVPILAWHNGTQPGVLIDQFQPSLAYLDCYIYDTNNVSHKISLSGWSAGVWHHVALTYDKTTGLAAVFLNGVLNNTLNLGIFEPQTSYDFYMGGYPGAGQARYKGLLDEVALYRRALTEQEIYAIFAAGATGKCPKDGNRGPVVDAGPDRVLAGASSLVLNGYVEDDGLPEASTILSAWSKLSGPGTATFANSNAPVTSVSFTAPGIYLLKLTADDSSVVYSDVVEVRVETIAENTSTNALAVLWPADGNNIDILAGNVAYLANGASYQTGKVGQGFYFDGVNDFAKVFAHPSHDIGDADAFTIEFWLNAYSIPSNFSPALLHWSSFSSIGAQIGIRFSRELQVFLYDANGVSRSLPGPSIPTGQFVHIAITYNRNTGIGRVYNNGVMVSSTQIGSFRVQTGRDLFLGGTRSGGSPFNGVMDEISLYRRELSGEEVYNIFNAGSRGEAHPGINLPPVVNAGQDLVLGSTNAPALLQGSAKDDTMPEGYLIKQWTKVGGPGNAIFAASNEEVTAVTFDQPGLYVLQLAANDGLVENKDLVQVRVGAECLTCPAEDLKAWWPFNDSNRDVVQGLEAAYYSGAMLTNGMVGGSLSTMSPSSHVRIEANPAIDIGQMDQYTMEFWIKPAAVSGNWWEARPSVLWTGPGGDGCALWTYTGVRIALTTITNTSVLVEGGNQMQAGVWRHIATTYDRSTGIYQIFIDGNLIRQQVIGNITLRTGGQLYLGTPPSQSNHSLTQLDEFAIHGRALNEDEVRNLYMAGAAGKCPENGNAAPVVFAGADFAFTDGLNTTTLMGQVSDDGLPSGINVTSVWRMVSGPGQVAFGTPYALTSTATFSTNGLYLLELTATDGERRTTDQVEVRVNTNCVVGELSGLVGWWPANKHARDITEGMDGILANGASYTTGKVASAFSFDGANDYVRIPASAGVNIGTNDAFSVEFWFNPGTTAYNSWEPRMVMGWRDGTMLYHYSSFTWHLMQTNGVNHAMTAGGPLSANTWQHVVLTYNSASGMAHMYVNGAERFSQNRGSFKVKTTGDFYLGGHLDQGRPFWGALDEVSLYNRELSVSEIGTLHAAGSVGKCQTPRNDAPFVFAGANRTHYLPHIATLNGAVYDDGRPVGGTLDTDWTYVSGPAPVVIGDTNAPVTTVQFTQPGVYEFELTAYDGEYLDYDTVTIKVLADPRVAPVVSLSSPADPMLVAVSSGGAANITVTATATDIDGAVAQVELFQGNTSLGVFTNAPYSVTLNGLGEGAYAFTAVATDDDGLVSTSAVAHAYVYVDNGPPVVEITSPADATEVTAPTVVNGTANSAILAYSVLEYRAISPNNANAWITLSSNTVSVVNGTLGTLDPTLSLNGIYELRVRAMDVRNRTSTTEPITVVFDRNMKIGNFAFSFNDLTIPVAGIPITITRSYDSRNKETGDFGVGWTMDINNIRLQKNRHLGINWEQTVEPGLFPVYGIRTTKSRVVTVTFPDGNVYKFGAVPSPSGQFGLPLIYPKIKFLPFQGTQGTLTPLVEIDGQLYPDDQVVYAGDNPGFGPLLSYELLLNPPPGAADNIYFNPDLFEFKTKEGYTYIISETNGLRSITDPNNNTLTFTANGILHSTGKSVIFERNVAGMITNIVDAAGNEMHYQYDTNGNLMTFIDRAGETNSFTYDGKHNLLTVTDKRGVQSSSNDYDAAGRLIVQTDADGFSIGHNHDLVNRRDYTTNRLGHVTMKEYDERGNITRFIDAIGAETVSTYDLNDNLLSKTDPLGRRMTYAYDALDNRIAVTNEACGCVATHFTYNAYGKVLTMKDSSGTVTNTYDSKGNMLSSSDTAGKLTLFTYDSKGKVVTMTDPKGGLSTFRYDGFGNLTNEVNSLGYEINYEIDANGKMLSMTSYRTAPQQLQLLSFGVKNKAVSTGKMGRFALSSGSTQPVRVRLYYDAAGRPVTTLFPDPQGEVSEQIAYLPDEEIHTDKKGRPTQRKFNTMGRLAEQINPDGTSISYTYDAEGRVACATDELGRQTCYEYDPRGKLTRTTFPDGCHIQAFYNLGGELIMEIDRHGATNTYTYDGAGNRITDTDTYGNTTTYTYNEHRAVVAQVDRLGRTKAFEYDFLNRHTNSMHPDGSTSSYTYDGRVLMSETDQLGNKTYRGYDLLGRLIAITNALGEVRRYEYDEAGNVITEVAPNNDITRFEYDIMNRRTKVIFPDGTFAASAYDATGQKISETDQAGATTFYTYDLRDRLIMKVDPQGYVTQYGYDAGSRLISVTNANNEVTRYIYDNGGRKIRTNHPDGSNEQDVYSDCGRLMTKIDRAGNETHYAYDKLGRMVLVTGPTGATTSFTYDSEGQVLTQTAADGAVTGYAYDLLGRQTHVFRPDGKSIVSTYDALGRVVAVKDEAGNNSYLGYDALGRTVARTNSLGQVTRFAYDSKGQLISQTDPANFTLTYGYDSLGRRTNVVYPDGGSVSWVYNARGQKTVQIDPNGNATWFAYDTKGRLVAITNALNQVTQFGYDVLDQMVTMTDAANRTTTFTYDAMGRRTGVTYADGANFTTTYDTRGLAIVETDALGRSTHFGYDEAGRVVAVTNALSETSYFAYDPMGRVVASVDANNRTNYFVYDTLGRPVSAIRPDLTEAHTFYDDLGRRTAVTDQSGKSTWFGYDSLGRMTSVTNSLGQVTRYEFDAKGQMTAQIDASNRITRYEYDSMGRRTKRILPDNKEEIYRYDLNGNLTNRTDFNGRTTTYVYDALNRLTSKIPDAVFGQAPVQYGYTVTGARQSMTDALGTTTYGYDLRDRLLQKAAPHGTLNYTYDLNGNLRTMQSARVNGVDVEYEYDLLNRMNAVVDQHTGRTTYTFDPVGNLQGFTYPNGINHYHQYDPLDRLTNLTASTVLTNVSSYAYTLLPSGHRQSVQELSGRTVTYGYDATYRLTNETVNVPGWPSAGTVDYGYDATGNRLSRNSNLPQLPLQAFTYDANDRLNGETYDHNGNTLTSTNVWSAFSTSVPVNDKYDSEDMLVDRGNGQVTIVYDGDGNRVKKTVNGVATWYLVDDLNPTGYAQVVEELATNSQNTAQLDVMRVYVWGHQLVSMDQVSGNDWVPSFYGYDGKGSVRQLYDQYGTVTDTYDYDAFGNL
ncbi:MAG TPA: putative Ig domain-containing protein, partial [Verrucomicrobiae bacterium]